ncbi:MAG TPA: NAD(P)-dependent alcohol dehydrogenase [Actinomycetota bacterium]|nr:NAD(P)-dependent alcohol dehydrogenase [Actinomycetota bacterium]
MRAVIQDRYGAPGVALHIVDDLNRPAAKEDEVLVKVHASTVTRGEAMGVRFKEYRFTRVFVGIRRPRRPICGMEFAGRVEEVGSGVSRFKVGDEVFGIDNGTCAEYVAVGESSAIEHKPAGMSFEEATAIPDGSLLALTCLKPAYPLEGKNVLVYGAAGSVGTAAVQLLMKHFNAAQVTAVCDTKDVEVLGGLGAHHVIDRFTEDFTTNGKTYDVIFDAVGKHSFRLCRQSLKSRGIYVSMDLGYSYHLLFLGPITKLLGRKRAAVGIGRYRKEDLSLIKDLVEAGKYRPVLDRTYSMDDYVEAATYVESGQKTGNVVIRVAEVGSDGHRD